ncbi:Leucine Rich Repeat domain protein [Aspergillus alliaceus]|uniref:Leucine Rich Repeat domain protein n=1 Tax=Petromyces alliaceus TaxID=209559 RepID=UPI0012A7341D|nr:uncharacterized protein BDW43DRAFT_316799 [Aspergillus alliaceus]KAB8227434.1 hypothetical protein BDW43DRAFT_316799 [Aspergillus alliaceus]
MTGSQGIARGEAAALQQRGQQLYQADRFQAALDAFTEALNMKDADHLGILDNRAATYTKLGQYDRALKDARQMIKKDKQDERGYLRCAKSLFLDGKYDKAVEVYAYALKTLPSSHPRRELVERLHNKLRDKMAAKCRDPFSILPLEIAAMVLNHFDFKQIVAILRVSKQWNNFLSSMRYLWMRVDLSGARCKIHWFSVRAYIRRSKSMLTHAIVKNLSAGSSERVLGFLSRCPKLEYLEVWTPFACQAFYDMFKGSKRMKTLVISGQMPVPQEYLAKFLASLPLLEYIKIHKSRTSLSSKVQWPPELPHLRSIILGTTEGSWLNGHTSALHIPRKQPSIPYSIANLEELCLNSDPDVFFPYPPSFNPLDLTRLRRLDLSGIYISDEFALPPSLEYLRICGGAATDEFPFSNQRPVEFHKLSTIMFVDVPWVSNNTMLIFLLEAKAPLKVLHVESCFRIRGTAFWDSLCEHANELTELNVSSVLGINDTFSSRIIEEMSALKVINVSYTDITGISIKKFADARASKANVMKVERIYAKGCEHVSSDAVAYGRTSGIEIII